MSHETTPSDLRPQWSKHGLSLCTGASIIFFDQNYPTTYLALLNFIRVSSFIRLKKVSAKVFRIDI